MDTVMHHSDPFSMKYLISQMLGVLLADSLELSAPQLQWDPQPGHPSSQSGPYPMTAWCRNINVWHLSSTQEISKEPLLVPRAPVWSAKTVVRSAMQLHLPLPNPASISSHLQVSIPSAHVINMGSPNLPAPEPASQQSHPAMVGPGVACESRDKTGFWSWVPCHLLAMRTTSLVVGRA